MKKRKLFFIAVASCLMLALPVKAYADSLATAQGVEGKKTLPYPRATNAGVTGNIGAK